jgi:predicted amidohydrolase
MSVIRAAAIQTEPVFGEIDHNLDTSLAAIPDGCDLAVLPELFTTGYQFRSRQEALDLAETIPTGKASSRLRDMAVSREKTIVAGLAERDGDKLFNSCVLVRPDGSWERYRKIHLFWDEKSIFDPGDLGFRVHSACGTEIGLMICFDWIFPEAARTLALAGASIVCHPSNLVLPHCPQSMITRCVENRVFAITANRVGCEHRTADPLEFIGLSRIIDPGGQVLATCDEKNASVARAVCDTRETDKQVTPRNHLWQDRRPETYRL